MNRDPFVAIADANRREMIRLLSSGPKTINELSSHFTMSRPAVSKHVKIMEECGVVRIRPEGRERIASLDFLALQEISIWLNNYEEFWNERFDGLADYLAKRRLTQ